MISTINHDRNYYGISCTKSSLQFCCIIVIKGRLKELFFMQRKAITKVLASRWLCGHLTVPIPASPLFLPAHATALPKDLFQALSCRLISTNLYICSDQQHLSRAPWGHLRAESPFHVQYGREKMGGSALCCVSQGVQEQGCWGAKPLQLIDLISTRGPGPPLVTEIHITHALLHLTNRSEVKLLHRGRIYSLQVDNLF